MSYIDAMQWCLQDQAPTVIKFNVFLTTTSMIEVMFLISQICIYMKKKILWCRAGMMPWNYGWITCAQERNKTRAGILDFYKKSPRVDFRLLQEVTDIGFRTLSKSHPDCLHAALVLAFLSVCLSRQSSWQSMWALLQEVTEIKFRLFKKVTKIWF